VSTVETRAKHNCATSPSYTSTGSLYYTPWTYVTHLCTSVLYPEPTKPNSRRSWQHLHDSLRRVARLAVSRANRPEVSGIQIEMKRGSIHIGAPGGDSHGVHGRIVVDSCPLARRVKSTWPRCSLQPGLRVKEQNHPQRQAKNSAVCHGVLLN